MSVNNNISKSLKTLLILLLIVAGGSVVGIAYSRITDTLFLAVAIIYLFFFCSGIIKNINAVKMWAVLFLFYIVNFVIFSTDSPNMTAYIVYVMRMTACMLFCNIFTMDEFKHYFHRAIFAISVISLIAFVVIMNINYRQYLIYMNDLPMFGIFNCKAIPTGRNSSVFWEPGAYQIFINLALLFHFEEKNFSKESLFSFETLVLVVSLVTTFSTSGYFAFAVVMAFYIVKNWNNMETRTKILTLIPTLILIGAVVYIILSSNAVVDKFQVRNTSYIRRQADLYNSIEALKASPLHGYGIGTNSFYYMIENHNLFSNSIGVFASSLNLGIIYVALFLAGLLYRGLKEYKNILIPYIAIILITAVTEDFFRYSIYFVLLFGFSYITGKDEL